MSEEDNITNSLPNEDLVAIKDALLQLRDSGLGFLVGGPKAAPPRSTSSPIIPIPAFDTMAIIPKTTNERLLLAALHESEAQINHYRQHTIALQATKTSSTRLIASPCRRSLLFERTKD